MLRTFNKKYVPPLEGYRFLKLCTASYKLSEIMLTGWKPNITRTQTVPFRIMKCNLLHIFIASGS